jgi:hypothetical protein
MSCYIRIVGLIYDVFWCLRNIDYWWSRDNHSSAEGCKRFRLERDRHCMEREFTVYTTERTRFRLERDRHCIEREFTVYTTERTCSILLRAVKGLDYREIGTALRENLLSAYNRGPAQFCSGSLYMHFCRGL